MCHVSFDQVSGSKCGTETQFAGEHGRSHDTGQATRVLAGIGGVGATDAKHVEHAGLCLEDGAAADGADFDGGHRDGNLEVTVVTLYGGKGKRASQYSGISFFFFQLQDVDGIKLTSS